jgi:hypothetical protein
LARFSGVSGWAPVIYPASRWAAGGILAVANVLPDACVTLFGYATGGRAVEALSLQRAITLLARLVSSVHGILPKHALDMIGSPEARPTAADAGLDRAREIGQPAAFSDRPSMLPTTDRLLLVRGPLVSPRVTAALGALARPMDPEMVAILDDIRARLARVIRHRRARWPWLFRHGDGRDGGGRRQCGQPGAARRRGHGVFRRSPRTDAGALR